MRAFGGLAVLLGVAIFLAYLHAIGKAPFDSPAARHLREMKDRLAGPARLEPIGYDSLAALPRHRPLAEYSRIEGRAVSLEGYVPHMLRAADGDFHLEICPTPEPPGGRQVYQTAEITPGWRRRGAGRGADPARGWSYEHLAAVFRPNVSGLGPAWDAGPALVRVSGWLLYDYPFDQEVDRFGRRHDPRISGWEIHPVTRIERWSPARREWVEVRP